MYKQLRYNHQKQRQKQKIRPYINYKQSHRISLCVGRLYLLYAMRYTDSLCQTIQVQLTPLHPCPCRMDDSMLVLSQMTPQ